jgi:hypothetical protein
MGLIKIIKKIPGVLPVARKLGLVRSSTAKQRSFILRRFPKESVGAEIGVHIGDFSAQILKIVKPKEFHLIDPWQYEGSQTYKDALYGGKALGGQAEMDARYESVLKRFDDNINKGQVFVHRCCSDEACRDFPDNHFDWIYIDGNHLYEFVKQDLESYCQKVKIGGYITGDDYAGWGWWQGGVKKAVDEFIQTNRVKLERIKDGQFTLIRVC